MTAEHGIAHSEASTGLHGVQLWVDLPLVDRDTGRGFEHHVPERRDLPDGAGSALVFSGALVGVDTSPVHTFTPLLELADPRVLDAVSPHAGEGFDPEHFLTEHGTLCLLATGAGAGASAALVAAFVETSSRPPGGWRTLTPLVHRRPTHGGADDSPPSTPKNSGPEGDHTAPRSDTANPYEKPTLTRAYTSG